MTNQSNTAENKETKFKEVEMLRLKYAFWIALSGFLISGIIIVILVFSSKYSSASDITSIAGLITTALGTIVGAFFGLQIGSSGKEAAEDRAEKTQKKVDALSAAADESTIRKAKDIYTDLFS